MLPPRWTIRNFCSCQSTHKAEEKSHHINRKGPLFFYEAILPSFKAYPDLPREVSFVRFPPVLSEENTNELKFIYNTHDVFVALERASRAVTPLVESDTKLASLNIDTANSDNINRSKGKYKSMRGLDLSAKVAPLDVLFGWSESAKSNQLLTEKYTIGIGDGGNELGMGKARNAIAKSVHLGEEICSDTSCDYLITVSVSNWGGWALSGALWALEQCQMAFKGCTDNHARHLSPGPAINSKQCFFLPTDQEEHGLAKSLESSGVRDGTNPNLSLSVDGFDMETNLSYLNSIRQILLELDVDSFKTDL
eukprot:Filipodium_phascolosomae@DN2614_c0_g1_i7.p1